MTKITYKKNVFLPILFLLCIIGLVSIDRNRAIPATPILESLFFIGTILLIKKIDDKAIVFSLVSIGYIVYSSIKASIYSQTNILDFIQAYKAFIYIIFLAFAIGKKIFTKNFITKIFNLLLFFLIFKYSYSVLLGYDNRPILFTENNYELFFFLLIYYLKYIMNNHLFKISEFLLMTYIFIISGSRSALAALVFIYTAISIKKIDLKLFLHIVFLLVLVTALIFVFMERMHGNNIESIDRFRFLMYFLHETASWEWWKWFVGSPPLTPLHQDTCNALSFYHTLLSHKHDGSCYSVIFHSYLLRVIFDHGLLGLLFILTFINYGLKKATFSLKERITFIVVIIINALSVSSVNNVYIAFPILFYFSSIRHYNIDQVYQNKSEEKNYENK